MAPHVEDRDQWTKEDYLPERPLRRLPKGGGLVEVTTRTFQGRLLIKPTEDCKELVRGVIGRTLWKYPDIRLVAYFFLSNRSATRRDSHALSVFDRVPDHARPLPCWAKFPPTELRARCLELIREIEAEGVERNKALAADRWA